MLDEQVNNLVVILKNKDVHQYAGEAIWDLVKALVTGDPFSGVSAIKNVKDLVWNIPTVLFWDKMQKFLLGTYHNFDEQLKMASKFDNEKDYIEFTKRQIQIVNQINEDAILDYFAKLTRSLLAENVDKQQYFRLAKCLQDSIADDLVYLSNHINDTQVSWNENIAGLELNGLAYQSVIDGGDAFGNSDNKYDFTEMARAMSTYCLYNDESVGTGDFKI